MKVIHLISGGDTGGAKTHVITLLKTLMTKVDIELICLADGVFAREAIENKIPTEVLLQSSRFDLSVLSKIEKKIQDNHVEILHCHGARANFIGSLMKKRIQIPVITTMHSDYEHDFDNNWLKKIVFTNLNKFSLNKMDYFLAVTENFKEMLVNKGFSEKKIYVIYNGISTKVKPATKTREEFLTRLNLEILNNQFLIGCATRLHPIKGTDVLLRAAKLLTDEYQHIHFLVAGFGDAKYTQYVKLFIEENKLEKTVHLLGFVEDMDNFYSAVDVNLLPSYSESFPYALLEGGIRQLPTVASKAGGIVEMIQPEFSGLLFEVGDESGLAKSLLRYYHNAEEAKNFGVEFKRQIEEKFSDQIMADRHVWIYKDLVGRSRK